ncbi:hypothetical protein EG329_010741 [Mollisiaceae sp. DMI_Dod_QoI]|nr:hypothetical protein EG329_010741 [Helotiales sp. DMI_Dod_QoI]
MAATTKKPRPMDANIIYDGVEETSEEERTSHPASCHCGAVKYTVTLKWPFPKYPVNTCSCSYDNLGSYRFNTKTKSHKFCKTCGTSVGIDFLRAEQGEPDPAKDTFGINVRTFTELDLNSLEYTFFDGKKRL